MIRKESYIINEMFLMYANSSAFKNPPSGPLCIHGRSACLVCGGLSGVVTGNELGD